MDQIEIWTDKKVKRILPQTIQNILNHVEIFKAYVKRSILRMNLPA